MADAQLSDKQLLTDAVALAISSAAAYAVAFLYETGFADCYGYPSWSIDIGLANLVLAWVSVALCLLTLVIVYFLIGLFIPASLVTKVLLTRAGVFAFYSLAMVASAPVLHLHPGFIAVSMPILFGLLFLLIAAQVWTGFRQADSSKPFIERLSAGADRFARWHDEASIRYNDPEDFLTLRTLKVPVLGRLYAVSILVLLPCGIVIAFANSFGSFVASRQREYWVSTSKPMLVALRRYGDAVIVTPIDSQKPAIGSRPIQVLPWQSVDRTWELRVPDSTTRARLACR